MLTIGQLAQYLRVTPRAIRHYHRLGLLHEPVRSTSGYRLYDAQAVVDLQRIKVLTDAGVPLARVGELADASPEVLRAAVAELDAQVRDRISSLKHTRAALRSLANGETGALPAGVLELQQRMRELGVSERTLTLERDGWILIHALYPHLTEQWYQTQVSMLDDPDYRDLYLLTDQAFDWDPDDPRVEDLARRTVEWTLAHWTVGQGGWETDTTAAELVTTYRRDASPAWRRYLDRVEAWFLELAPSGPPGSSVATEPDIPDPPEPVASR